MKILVAIHEVMDLGGIINHTEQLIGGLKDLGHEVVFKKFVWAERISERVKPNQGLIGPSGISHLQGKGWGWKISDCVLYKGRVLTGAYRLWLAREKFDLIIWTVPVPSTGKKNLGNSDWLDLYDVPTGTKQMAFIHDGNSARGYPHIMRIEDHLDAVACVHPCALNSSGFLDVPRAMVVNPQENPVRQFPSWEEKKPGFVNMQTFKAWKHAHELIECIPFMPEKEPDELREVAGMGIEYQYMTSEEKCKDHYYHVNHDGEWFDGMKFWDAAVGHGMNHHDYWDVNEVDHMLRQARVLVDPSWSTRYSADGGHFNRVVVDAMIRGAIPVARVLGMGTEVFQAGVHYVEIPMDAGPQEYADIIQRTSRMSSGEARFFQSNCRELLPMFDRRVVAQRTIDLAFGNIETQGKSRSRPTAAADRIMFEKFGSL